MKDHKYSDKLTGKIIVTAEFITIAPFLIGGGTSDNTDINVVTLPDGRPYIPASSLTGVLKSFFDNYIELSDNEKELTKAFWGTRQSEANQDDKVYQSHIIVDDLLPIDADKSKIKERDGIKIDYTRGITENKYDYEIVEPECSFQFRMEVTIREGMNVEIIKKWIHFICSQLQDDKVRIGAMTSTGFGKFNCKNLTGYHFDFTNKEKKAAEEWSDYLSTNKLPINNIDLSPTDEFKQQTFSIEATFKLKTALITGTYGVLSGEPDKVQLTSNGKAVLSGKSIKGAIRSRALKILSTKKEVSVAERELYDMLGWVDERQSWIDEKGMVRKASKSRLVIEEVILNDVKKQQQPRIRINRFEGDASESALFNSEPVWKNGDANFCIRMELKTKNDKDWEIGLLLHLLKDLWTSDLPIGGEKNIGRGTLVGVAAKIQYQQDDVTITEKDGVLQISKKELLENWGKPFNQMKQEVLHA